MRKSRLTWPKQSELIGLFIDGTSTRSAAEVVQVNKNTANSFFNRLRQLIYTRSATAGFLQAEVVEGGEAIQTSMSPVVGARYPRSFGLVVDGSSVHIAILPGSVAGPQPQIIRGRKTPDYLLFIGPRNEKHCAVVTPSDGGSHFRIRQCDQNSCPVSYQGAEKNFCDFYSAQQKRYHGIPEKYFYLYLKEFEWKFNHPDKSLQRRQLEEWAVRELA